MRLASAGLLLVALAGCHRAEVDLAELIDPAIGGASARPSVARPLAPDGFPWLGSACASDAECSGQGLRCLLPTQSYDNESSAAAPHGLCTADCVSDADCGIFDPSAVCASLVEGPWSERAPTPSARLCLQGCSLGAPAGDIKCHGRSEMACRPFTPAGTAACSREQPCPVGTFCLRGICRESACGASCNSDADCSRGRHCNPSSGLCDTRTSESPLLGADCFDEARACGAGSCVEVLAESGDLLKRMCTQSCTIGSVCAAGAGACTAPRVGNYAVGDAGYCQPLCHCDADCLHPADRCLAWASDALAEHFGARGFCDVPVAEELGFSCEGETQSRDAP